MCSIRYLCVLKDHPELQEFIWQDHIEEAAETFLGILYTEKRLPKQGVYYVYVKMDGDSLVYRVKCVQEIVVAHVAKGEVEEIGKLEPGETLIEVVAKGDE